MTEPTDEEVEQFIEEHPGGGTLEEIAAMLGITKQRAFQILNRAVEKVQTALSRRHLRMDDLVL